MASNLNYTVPGAVYQYLLCIILLLTIEKVTHVLISFKIQYYDVV